jgi:hypothetical protein
MPPKGPVSRTTAEGVSEVVSEGAPLEHEGGAPSEPRRRRKNKGWEFVVKMTLPDSEQMQYSLMREGYVKGRSNKSARSTVREYLCGYHRHGCKYTKRFVASTTDPEFVVLEEVNDHSNHDTQATRNMGMTEAQKAFIRYAHEHGQKRPLQTLRFFDTKRKRGEDVPPKPSAQQISNFNTYQKKKIRTVQEGEQDMTSQTAGVGIDV